MVVHQLQRLASAPEPSSAVAAKLPRMAIGLSFFIDHPEIGVRQQAAKAVCLVCKQHASLLRETPEGRELLSTLTRHAHSSLDPVILDCCKDAIQALEGKGGRKDAGEEDKRKSEEEKDRTASCSTGERGACPDNNNGAVPRGQENASSFAGGDVVGTNVKEGEKSSLARGPESMEGEETSEDRGGYAPAAAPFSRSTSVIDGVMYTVLLGLRGLLVELRRIRTEQEEKEKTKNNDNNNGKITPSPMPSFSSKESKAKLLLDELQKQLQYRLVCVPGVSSATITLNIRSLARQLEKEEEGERQRNKKSKEDAEGGEQGDGKREELEETTEGQDAQKEGGQEEKKGETKKREEEEEEGDGVAVLLMRLSSAPKQRLHQLHQVKESAGPLTLVLRAERIYSPKESSRAGGKSDPQKNSRSNGSAHKSRAKGDTKKGNQRRVSSASKQERRRHCNSTQVGKDGLGHDEEEEEENDESEEDDGDLRKASRASSNTEDDNDCASERAGCFSATSMTVGSSTQASSPAYLDDETGGDQDATAAAGGDAGIFGTCRSGEGLHGTGETAAGYSFFSRNSVLFSKSRKQRVCTYCYWWGHGVVAPCFECLREGLYGQANSCVSTSGDTREDWETRDYQ